MNVPCDSDLNDENAKKAVESKVESETGKKLFDKLTPFLKTRVYIKSVRTIPECLAECILQIKNAKGNSMKY